MATSRRRLSEQEISEVSSNSESGFESVSEVTKDSIDYCIDSDDDFDDNSSRSAAPVYDGTWKTGDFHPKKLTFSSTSSGYNSPVPQKLNFFVYTLTKIW
jgi:hypothetical protein